MRHRLLFGLLLGVSGCFGTRSVVTPAQTAMNSALDRSTKQETPADSALWLLEQGEELLSAFPVERDVYVFVLKNLSTVGYAGLAGSPVDTFAQGKAVARGCLRLNGAWEVMERLDGGRITIPALRRLETQDLPCARQLVFHWTSWVKAQGPSGFVDLKVIESLAERVLEIAQGEEQWIEHWALGMVVGLSTGDKDSLPNMEIYFQRAQELQPGLSIPSIDRLSLMIQHGDTGDRVRTELREWSSKPFPVQDNAAWALENQASLKRAIDLLGGLRKPDSN